ncbi:MAG: efflux RND transporter periplasmic adaptor subunit [Nitrospirota bacterium]|nr:efflux RND transporter periplasmic adaptor subunit [Nitrospirota bacterium]MDE3241477.1 efflux RND transporter periplasmic adaptor subunit [Nitrospirota bacterium]
MNRGCRAVLWLAPFLLLASCGQHEEPTTSNAATPRLAPAPPGTGQARIETAVVATTQINPVVTLAGKIAYGEDRYSRISSPLQGRVLEVRVKLGDRVKAGDVLLIIDSPDITSAYSEFIKEASDMDFATRAYDLAKDLYENKAIPLKDYKQAENDLVKAKAEFRRAKERLLSLRVPAGELDKPLAEQKITARFEMKSPLTGTVVERTVTPGSIVGGDQSQVLFTVADLDNLQVVADVYERDLDLVHVGQVAAVTVEAYPATTFSGAIAAIGDVVDPNTRTIKVRAWVTNEQHKLKPEMFARLHIQVGDASAFLTVPKEAVLEVDGKHFVYVVEGEGKYLKREVKIATASGDQVRVVDGLKPGERIVTKGAVLVKGQESKG